MAVPPRARTSRRALVPALLVLAVPLVVYTTLSMRGNVAWQAYGIDPMRTSFADMRGLTTAADCERKGIDTLKRNPCNPYDIPANNPRPWVTVTTALGVSERHTALLAGVVAAAFAAGVWSLLRVRSGVDALVWVVVLCSPPVLLAVERGNPDLLAFGLLAAALVAARRGRRPALTWLAWAGAVLAKLFPLFAAPAFLVSADRRTRRVGLGAIALVGAWLALTADDLRTINRVVPQATRVSYGARVLFAHLAGDVVTPEQRTWGFVLAAALALVVVLLVRPGAPVPATHLRAFHVGVLVYASTFVLASHWEYRLIFVLFALPQLLEWLGRGDGLLRAQSAAAVALIGMVLWLGHGNRTDALVDDVASWALLLSLVGLTRLTLPPLPPAWRPRLARQA